MAKPKRPASTFPTRAKSERRREFIRAERAQLDLDERLATVALVADMDAAEKLSLQKMRERVMATPAGLAPALAGELPAVVKRRLRQAVIALLTELAGAGG